MIYRFLIKLSPTWIWTFLIKVDPNWCDYFRGAAWSIAGSIVVTIALKYETWEGISLGLLAISFIIFSISASLWTLLSNAIKKYQSEFSDRKLIDRSQNKFADSGTSYDLLIHEHNTSNVNYPNFLNLEQFIDNKENDKSAKDKNVRGNYSFISANAVATLIIGLILVWFAAKTSIKQDNTANNYYDSSTIKLDRMIQIQDSLHFIYQSDKDSLMQKIQLLEVNIDTLLKRNCLSE